MIWKVSSDFCRTICLLYTLPFRFITKSNNLLYLPKPCHFPVTSLTVLNLFFFWFFFIICYTDVLKLMRSLQQFVSGSNGNINYLSVKFTLNWECYNILNVWTHHMNSFLKTIHEIWRWNASWNQDLSLRDLHLSWLLKHVFRARLRFIDHLFYL